MNEQETFLFVVGTGLAISFVLSLAHSDRDRYERKIPEEEMKQFLTSETKYEDRCARK